MEVDGDLEVVTISESAGTLLDGADLGVEALGDGIGDGMSKVRF